MYANTVGSGTKKAFSTKLAKANENKNLNDYLPKTNLYLRKQRWKVLLTQ